MKQKIDMSTSLSCFLKPHRTLADIRTRIVEQLKDISYETKILKDLRETTFDDKTVPHIWSNAEMFETASQTDNFMSESPFKIESLPIVNSVKNVQSDELTSKLTVKDISSGAMHLINTLQADDTRKISAMETAACKADDQCCDKSEEALIVSSIYPLNTSFVKITHNMICRLNVCFCLFFVATRW